MNEVVTKVITYNIVTYSMEWKQVAMHVDGGVSKEYFRNVQDPV